MLVATIAEMDFPLAGPVAASQRAAIDRHDLGYATPAYSPFLGELPQEPALVAEAARRVRTAVRTRAPGAP